MAGRIEARLAELKIELPKAAIPVANYVPVVTVGNLAFVSGQVTIWNGEFRYKGRLGQEFKIEDGQAAARLCALNVVAQLKNALGDLDRVKRCELGERLHRPAEGGERRLRPDGRGVRRRRQAHPLGRRRQRAAAQRGGRGRGHLRVRLRRDDRHRGRMHA